MAVVKPVLSLLLLTLGCCLASCNGAAPPAAQSPSPSAPPESPERVAASPSPTPSPSSQASPAAENLLISPQGIGAAQLGMTLAELKQRLGPDYSFTIKSPFIVDFDAIAVQKAGEVQYYILYLAGQSFGENEPIQGLLTENPKFRTAEAIGPGTTIVAAERAYGKATLAYNVDNETREYVRFANQNQRNLSFGTGYGNADSAGVYASLGGGYNETQQFKPESTIKTVWVVCLSDACAQASSAQPSP
ncbi:MAG: hypothetical protein ACKO7W_24395 [Elainella sp.]